MVRSMTGVNGGGSAESGAGLVYCLSCGRTRAGGEFRCPACRCTVYGPRIPGNLVRVPLQEPGDHLAGLLGRVLDRFPAGRLALLYGPRGIGKSTVALSAWKLGAHVYTLEMDPALVADYCHRIGTTPAWIIAPSSPSELVYPPEALRVVLDSLSATGPEAVPCLQALLAHCRGTGARAIVVVHTTKAGTIRGPETIPHLADTVVRLEELDGNRALVPEKHRGSPARAVLYRITDRGAVLPAWDRYYSVEGTPPGLRLVAFPSPGTWTRHAGRLARAAKKRDGTLPPPPLALSMLDAGQLGGWVEPPDGAERERFSIAHGLAYLRADGFLARDGLADELEEAEAEAATDEPDRGDQ